MSSIDSEISGEIEIEKDIYGSIFTLNVREEESVVFDKSDRKSFTYFDSTTKPFDPTGTFGVNVDSDCLNCSGSFQHGYIIYSSSHVIVLYDLLTKKQHLLTGHVSTVTNLSIDGNCKYLATCCNSADSLILLWELETRSPIHTIFDSHPSNGIAKIKLSHNAKNLVTIGREPNPLIKFWLWTYGNDKEDDVYECSSTFGKTKNICFSPINNNHFVVTFEHQILFLTWEDKLRTSIPTTKNENNLGPYTSSTYVEQSDKCVTATKHGWVIVWGNYFYEKPCDPTNITNDKIFIRAVKLQKSAITVITSFDNVVVTGDVKGRVKFYDKQMKILYWCQNFRIESIVSLECNVNPRRYKLKDPMEWGSEMDYKDDYDDKSEDYEKIYYGLVPTDATIDKMPFVVRDFIIMSQNGQIGYINFLTNTYELIKHKSEAKITCIEAHPEKPIILISYASGRICVYDYISCDIITEYNLFEKENVMITCIKCSFNGDYIACGTSNGRLYFLQSVTLEPQGQTWQLNNEEIVDSTFSQTIKYFVYHDKSRQIILLKFDKLLCKFQFYSRTIAHSMDIVNILFTNNENKTRLFSLGKDRLFIEYDIENSDEHRLNILKSHRIEQSAIPSAIIQYAPSSLVDKLCFLMCNDQYKYKIISEKGDEMVCQQTVLCPVLKDPLSQLIITGNGRYLLFSTGQYIGLQMFPLDANPFSFIANIGQSDTIEKLAVCKDGMYFFSMAKNDNCCLMSRMNFRAVRKTCAKGGKGLMPYDILIDGGLNGWLFKEIEDLFYYMQILHQGVDSETTRDISNNICLTELSNLMRAIGFFPTEYEMENMLTEAKLISNDPPGEEQISFEDFLKMYINHKPNSGLSLLKLKTCFENFAEDGSIEKEKFINMLCTKGEPFEKEDLLQCLTVLMDNKKQEVEDVNILDKLPENVTFETLVEILGIDLDNVADYKSSPEINAKEADADQEMK